MSISLPVWMVVSQWILLFGLGFLVILMYRQMAYVMRVRDYGSERDGLAVGEAAPAFEYSGVNGSGGASERFEPKGAWSLLLFADPGCVSCEGALSAVEQLALEPGHSMRTLVVTSVEPARINAIEAFRTTSLPVVHVSGSVPDKQYRTHVTPFMYVIDPEGLVRVRGSATDRAGIKKLLGKLDRASTRQVAAISA